MPTPLLTVDMFGDKVGQTFALDGSQPLPIELTLTEAKALPKYNLPGGLREPFSLLFTTTGSFIMPQQIYILRHPVLGSVSIFLVPIGKDGDTVTYQAIFN